MSDACITCGTDTGWLWTVEGKVWCSPCMVAEIERLREIVTAQKALIGWYETDTERSQYDDADIPDELFALEKAAEAAKEKPNGKN